MQENDIRNSDFILKYNFLRKNAAKELIFQKKEFVKVNCPSCDNEKFLVEFEKEGFSFVRCKNCKTLFVNPRPTFEMLLDFYENSECFKFWDEKIFPLSENARRNYIFKPRAEKVIDLCEKYNVNKDLLIDIGAGFGTFCEEILKFNYFNNVLAIEPSIALADTCVKKGLQVIKKPIENIRLENVNVATNFELIEHLFCPISFLEECYKLLNNNGLLILTTPNIDGFDLSVLGSCSDNIVAPNHINYFNTDSICFLLKKIGFEICEISTPGKLDAELVRKKIINNDFDMKNNVFLKKILLEKWESLGKSFQEFLANNLLSSHMWVVARKI